MKFTSVQFPVGQNFILKYISWDFPGGSVVKTLPSNSGSAGSIPGWQLRSHMPHSQKNKL